MKTAINQTIKTCEVCGHQGVDVHEWPTYKDGLDKTEYQCDDVEACLVRKTKVQWLTATCACGAKFKYPDSGYRPVTCGSFGCEHKLQHPELIKA